MKNTCKGGLRDMKKWLCMLLILSIIGGDGALGTNGVPDDDPYDWHKTAGYLEEDIVHNA